MDIFSVFSLFGGLAFFLYGMQVMGNGLEKMAGGKLERILEGLTKNKLKAVLLGMGVTAIIQSSSATTVMVVGFVNSGIMKLSQAISVIMGANIGTTVTSWVLSLSGINGDSLLMNLLKPANFAPVFALVGIILIMFTNSSKKKDTGDILIGFAVLMSGMVMMSKAVEPLSDMPGFIRILTLFNNPIFGIIAGALLTAIIQSSSASVGILQALSATGAISFGAAIPIITGQNIGTCITALISCVGAKTNAKRAAFVHLYFNIIGTALFLACFYALNSVLKFSFLDQSISEFDIAVVHTVFNLVTTAVLLPFTKLLEKLAVLTVKSEEKKESDFAILDDRFLQSPAFALERCVIMTHRMAETVKKTAIKAFSLLDLYNDSTAKIVESNESKVDQYEDKIGNYLIKLAGKDMTGEDSETMTLLFKTIGDLERIADYGVNIMQSANEKNEKKIDFTQKAQRELAVLSEAVTEIIDLSINAFIKRDIEFAKSVEPLEEVVDELCRELRNRHIIRVQNGECSFETGFVFSDILTSVERISDHCSNIAIGIIQHDDDAIGNEYAHEIKRMGKSYTDKYSVYKEKYEI